MTDYRFGVPGIFVWVSHIIMGCGLAYIGKLMLDDVEIPKNVILLIIIIGSIAAVYHTHILIYEMYIEKDIKLEEKIAEEIKQEMIQENYYAGR
jgi:hypothetical protein